MNVLRSGLLAGGFGWALTAKHAARGGLCATKTQYSDWGHGWVVATGHAWQATLEGVLRTTLASYMNKDRCGRFTFSGQRSHDGVLPHRRSSAALRSTPSAAIGNGMFSRA